VTKIKISNEDLYVFEIEEQQERRRPKMRNVAKPAIAATNMFGAAGMFGGPLTTSDPDLEN
jgi:hypothetical protein